MEKLTFFDKDKKQVCVCGMNETNEVEKISAVVQKLYEFESTGISVENIKMLQEIFFHFCDSFEELKTEYEANKAQKVVVYDKTNKEVLNAFPISLIVNKDFLNNKNRYVFAVLKNNKCKGGG